MKSPWEARDTPTSSHCLLPPQDSCWRVGLCAQHEGPIQLLAGDHPECPQRVSMLHPRQELWAGVRGCEVRGEDCALLASQPFSWPQFPHV